MSKYLGIGNNLRQEVSVCNYSFVNLVKFLFISQSIENLLICLWKGVYVFPSTVIGRKLGILSIDGYVDVAIHPAYRILRIMLERSYNV